MEKGHARANLGIRIRRNTEMTMAIANTNGRARKSLADQIDRLDGILDGLAGALNEAVVAAVRQAVAVAVKTALAEALAHPDLRQRLVAAPPAEVGPRPSMLKRLLAATRRTTNRTTSAIGRFGRWVVEIVRDLPRNAVRLAAASYRLAWRGLRWLGTSARRLPVLIWRMRGPVLLALSVGGLVGWGCYVAGPIIAAGVGGLAGAAQTLTARAKRLQARPAGIIQAAKA
jgi:hypothetical protein